MKERIKKEGEMFKKIVEILVNKKIDDVISVTMFYGIRREETMLVTFLCKGKVETFAVCPQYDI